MKILIDNIVNIYLYYEYIINQNFEKLTKIISNKKSILVNIFLNFFYLVMC